MFCTFGRRDLRLSVQRRIARLQNEKTALEQKVDTATFTRVA
jgi:hypothetical protein